MKIIKKMSNNKLKALIYRMLKPKFLYFLMSHHRPISNIYGIERGSPVDRFYIENFLSENKGLIKGDCLELLNSNYTKKFGEKKVLKSDVLDIDTNNKNANIIGDLRDLKGLISDNTYDCIILTQVLQFIDNYDSALLECRRILKPNGCILITVPSLSRIDCASGIDNDFWRFTNASVNYILKTKFKDFEIKSYGNTKTGMAFWIGLSQSDISKSAFKFNDENFPILITAIAKK